MKMVSLKQPCNKITKSFLCPQHTNTMVNCIGALVRRRDGDTSAIWMVDIGFCCHNPRNLLVISGIASMHHFQFLLILKWGLVNPSTK